MYILLLGKAEAERRRLGGAEPVGDCQPVVQEAEREHGHRHQGEHEHAAGAQGRRPESAQGGELPSLNFPP